MMTEEPDCSHDQNPKPVTREAFDIAILCWSEEANKTLIAYADQCDTEIARLRELRENQ